MTREEERVSLLDGGWDDGPTGNIVRPAQPPTPNAAPAPAGATPPTAPAMPETEPTVEQSELRPTPTRTSATKGLHKATLLGVPAPRVIDLSDAERTRALREKGIVSEEETTLERTPATDQAEARAAMHLGPAPAALTPAAPPTVANLTPEERLAQWETRHSAVPSTNGAARAVEIPEASVMEAGRAALRSLPVETTPLAPAVATELHSTTPVAPEVAAATAAPWGETEGSQVVRDRPKPRTEPPPTAPARREGARKSVAPKKRPLHGEPLTGWLGWLTTPLPVGPLRLPGWAALALLGLLSAMAGFAGAAGGSQPAPIASGTPIAEPTLRAPLDAIASTAPEPVVPVPDELASLAEEERKAAEEEKQFLANLQREPQLLAVRGQQERLVRLLRREQGSGRVLAVLALLPTPEVADVLYEHWTGTAERSASTIAAEALLRRTDFQARLSAPLRAAVALRQAESCEALDTAVRLAEKDGDQRCIAPLAKVLHAKGCLPLPGTNKPRCLGCSVSKVDINTAILSARRRGSPL